MDKWLGGSIKVERFIDGTIRVHTTRGDGYGVTLVYTEEQFEEVRKLFASNATHAEVSNFTNRKFEVFVP